MFPEYIGYRQIVQIKSGTESFLYNSLMKKGEVTTAEPTEVYEMEAIQVVAHRIADIKQITINNRTLDIHDLTPVQLRNAVEHIDKVSFLLSNILIKVGEKIDLREKGVYTVVSGDTLSQIAQKFSMVTKDLVMYNTWLIDDGRIKFNYPTKVLVTAGTAISNVIDHNLIGDNVADILIDHNGGEDWLIGNGGDDLLDGGAGGDKLYGGADYDTYVAGGGDTIFDHDDKGQIYLFGNNPSNKLTGGKQLSMKEHVISQSNGKLHELNQQLKLVTQEYRNKLLAELTQKSKEATSLRTEVESISFRNAKQHITAPVDGYIGKLLVHTVGGGVTPAEKLVTLIPKDVPLIIHATVQNQDIGFITKGMDVAVKIDTFDFQKYGLINGKVKHIANDAIEDEKLGPVYEISIEPTNTTLKVEGQILPITAGMSVTAELKVGKRRVIEFFIYPMIKYLDEGLSVR